MAEMDIQEILKHLPQRYPMLMIDRVLEREPGKRIVAMKNVSANEPYFQGHFPGRPIMPGVLILEAMAQAAGAVFAGEAGRRRPTYVYYYAGIDNARFKRPVVPGDQLELEVTLERLLRSIGKFGCVARVGRRRGRRGDDPLRAAAGAGRMSARIHPTAIVDRGRAHRGRTSRSARTRSIGAQVEIGEGTWVGAHVVLDGNLRIGRRNKIFHFASLGAAPQDKKYAGEDTAVEIGDGNTIREYVTINRGTAQDVGVTRLGNDNWLMAYVHVAHDCQVGSHTIFANCTQLAGHVTIEDWVILGGFSAVHQFVRIGAHAFTGMGSAMSQDVPPYVTAAGNLAQPVRPQHQRAEAPRLQRRRPSPPSSAPTARSTAAA